MNTIVNLHQPVEFRVVGSHDVHCVVLEATKAAVTEMGVEALQSFFSGYRVSLEEQKAAA